MGLNGSVLVQTLSKGRPDAQDHFPSPPGPKGEIANKKKITFIYLIYYKAKIVH